MKGALAWPFMRLYLLTFFYFSGNSILNVLIPLKGEALGASNTSIGVIMGAYLFTTMFFRPWAGGLIQRHGPIKVLRVILLVNGVALVMYAVAGLGGYFIARVLQGVCTAFFSMALQLGIIDALPDKDRSQGISMYSLCSYLPGMIGPVLAIGIWQTGDMNLFAIIMIAIAFLTGAVGYTAKMDAKADESSGKSEQHSQATVMLQSFGQLVHNPHLFKSSVLMLSASLIFGAVTTFIPLYASQIERGSAAVYLMLQAAIVVAARFVLRRKIPSDGRWHSFFMMGTMLMLAVASLCISLATTAGAVLFYTGALLMGVAQALLYPTLTTYLSFVLPKENRNVLIGLFIAMADLGVSLGGIIMGPVADLTSYSMMYMLCTILGTAMILVAYDRRSLSEMERPSTKQSDVAKMKRDL
ncbi:staphylopine family metallophore export MFS transporter CntE [Brevibacillus reuszeri]|uniref:staphylopine family metallophore export MFS transporter CntE n=1 Tax=Brevibacillus reuszeri TaxID=54915 RepID=UPI000CCC2C0A|nr:MFS transporter [Brevibacillus reuszeri]